MNTEMNTEMNNWEPLERLFSTCQIPALSVAVVGRDRVLFSLERGIANLETGEKLTPQHRYDLASLTKVLVTLPLVMEPLEGKIWRLNQRLQDFYPDIAGDTAKITLEQILAHTSGLVPTVPLHLAGGGKSEILERILHLPLEFSPGAKCRYSDLGFMLLGDLLEREHGLALFDLIARVGPLRFGDVRFPLLPAVATEFCVWRGKMLQGQVHDEKAYAMGGAAGHAGAFGTLQEVASVAQNLLNTPPDLLERMTQVRSLEGDGCPRGLGWILGHPRCSGGSRSSRQAFGHTGFTGTSIWLEPLRGYAMILLSNRVHPTRQDGHDLLGLRRKFGETVASLEF
jgi:CubicO group peptidase (beta-lactamase class C family)